MFFILNGWSVWYLSSLHLFKKKGKKRKKELNQRFSSSGIDEKKSVVKYVLMDGPQSVTQHWAVTHGPSAAQKNPTASAMHRPHSVTQSVKGSV